MADEPMSDAEWEPFVTALGMEDTTDYEVCVSCDEPILAGNRAAPIGTPEGPRWTHAECMLRNVMGGIGHLIAHDYWCTQRKDPDAGLTYRQSSRLVGAWVEIVGHPADEES